MKWPSISAQDAALRPWGSYAAGHAHRLHSLYGVGCPARPSTRRSGNNVSLPASCPLPSPVLSECVPGADGFAPAKSGCSGFLKWRRSTQASVTTCRRLCFRAWPKIVCCAVSSGRCNGSFATLSSLTSVGSNSSQSSRMTCTIASRTSFRWATEPVSLMCPALATPSESWGAALFRALRRSASAALHRGGLDLCRRDRSGDPCWATEVEAAGASGALQSAPGGLKSVRSGRAGNVYFSLRTFVCVRVCVFRPLHLASSVMGTHFLERQCVSPWRGQS